jgi:hypothetical protein
MGWVRLEGSGSRARRARSRMRRYREGEVGTSRRPVCHVPSAEQWIAGRLPAEGHHVLALPNCRVPGTKSPDAALSGLLTEFKTFTGTSPAQILGRVARACAQANRVVIHTVGCLAADVDGVFRTTVHSAQRRELLAVKLVGPTITWNGVNGTRTPRHSTRAQMAHTRTLPVAVVVDAESDLRGPVNPGGLNTSYPAMR